MNFNQKVWNLCKKIPKGKVSTYKIIANVLGNKAYRAVGQALNKNPYKEVPCHRVVASTGHLHGFASGLEKKKKLLEKEGVAIKNYTVVNFEKLLHKFK